MKYYIEENIHTIKCSPQEFSLVLVNEKKKNVDKQAYTNANFFGNYSEQGEAFTLPAGHLVADYESDSKWERHYCEERGKFIGEKFYYDAGKWAGDSQFYGKSLTSLIIENNKARIEEIKNIQDSYQYVVSGVPVIRNGKDVKYYGDVTGQGYNTSVLYATKHIFVGLKKNDSNIYIMGYKTTSANLIYSAEMFKKLSALGYYDVIKLDGGGSYHFEVNGSVKDTMSENRRISGIICVKNIEEEKPTEDKDTVSDWAKISWDKAVEKKIVSSTDPQGNVTREMFAFILNKIGLLE